jgi:CubicO group peptidase (beta-lactamase class C family)
MVSILSLSASCSSGNVSHKSENIISKIELPDGWSRSTDDIPVVIAPEGDLKMYFFKVKLEHHFDFSQKSLELWKSIDPSFSYKEQRKASPPSTEGWDKITQIVYDTPAEDSKIVLSVLREKDGELFLNLITSSMATIGKRGPQMSTILDSWKPESIKKEDFSKVEAKKFSGNMEKKFEDFLKKTKKDLKLPGFAIGIVQDGKVVYKKGFGKTKVSNGKTINSDTLFMIGSTTKTLSTLLMSKLISDGKMNWNDRINLHLKDWSLSEVKDSDMMLMKHSACACTGMPRRDLDFIFEIDGITPEQRMLQMKGMSPTTKPGETFQYSNYLVAAGGFAAAKAFNPKLNLENAYKQAMQQLVFKPLKMTRSKVINTTPYVKNSAFPHSYNLSLRPELISTKLEEFANSVAPAGSVWSNVDDMVKYLSYELSNGEIYPDYITKDNLLLRRKKGVKITDDMNYGLGLFVGNNKGVEIFHHGGNTLGFTSDMFFIPSKGIGVVTLINLGSANTFRSSVKKKLLELFFGMDNKVDAGIAYYKKESKKSIKKLKSKIKPSISGKTTLLGKYKSNELGKLRLFIKSEKLYADFGEFTSLVKEKVSTGSKRIFLLMSSPWMGSFELIYDNGNFILDGGQKKYTFSKRAE